MYEKDIEKHLVKEVEALGGLAFKLTSPSTRGVPDRLVVFPSGVVWFIELKRPKGGRLAPMQGVWIKRLKALNANACFIKNLSELDNWLKDVKNAIRST